MTVKVVTPKRIKVALAGDRSPVKLFGPLVGRAARRFA